MWFRLPTFSICTRQGGWRTGVSNVFVCGCGCGVWVRDICVCVSMWLANGLPAHTSPKNYMSKCLDNAFRCLLRSCFVWLASVAMCHLRLFARLLDNKTHIQNRHFTLLSSRRDFAVALFFFFFIRSLVLYLKCPSPYAPVCSSKFSHCKIRHATFRSGDFFRLILIVSH